MPYELIIKTDISAAHNLRGYKGNCERLHGHNWHLDIVLAAKKLDAAGMALDFKEAKKIVKEVTDRFDHKYLNETAPFDKLNPSSENIAKTIAQEIAVRLPKGVRLARVLAWESDGCGAVYIADSK